MTSIGETLRRERLKRNLDLGQIAQELKISSRFLEAIEAGQLDKLPGGVFTRSFVVQYARLLGLDEEEIVGELQRTLDPPPEVPEFVEAPKPADPAIRVPRVEEWEAVGQSRFRWSSSLSAAALVVVAMLVCSGLYAWWQHTRRLPPVHESPPVAAVQPAPSPAPAEAPPSTAPQPSTAPDGTQPPSGAPVPAASTEQPAPPATPPLQPPAAAAGTSASHPNAAQAPAPAGASASHPNAAQPPAAAAGASASHPNATQAPAPAAGTSASHPNATQAPAPAGASASRPNATQAPAPAGASASRPNATQAPAPAGASASHPGAAVRVELTADEPVWVLVRNDGKYFFSGTLEAKESRTFEAASTVLVRLGNAGGVAITLNGKPVGPVGPKGQVRTVQFTSGGFEIVAAPKPPAPLDPL